MVKNDSVMQLIYLWRVTAVEGGPPKHLHMQIFGGGERLAGPARYNNCAVDLAFPISQSFSQMLG